MDKTNIFSRGRIAICNSSSALGDGVYFIIVSSFQAFTPTRIPNKSASKQDIRLKKGLSCVRKSKQSKLAGKSYCCMTTLDLMHATHSTDLALFNHYLSIQHFLVEKLDARQNRKC
ncbi:hypothetical protein GWI33_004032 [Rhynchophorus ferrugineus]|uniref:Uncharacterized protein n=1 Tax=Rhynchophorus ferrugineus TaxID=354439 RepID=A0A834MIZ2_RHYFE|nr:hypothetical protein GWI33_004032 [Rhynchophorus ferrugineus]